MTNNPLRTKDSEPGVGGGFRPQRVVDTEEKPIPGARVGAATMLAGGAVDDPVWGTGMTRGAYAPCHESCRPPFIPWTENVKVGVKDLIIALQAE